MEQRSRETTLYPSLRMTIAVIVGLAALASVSLSLLIDRLGAAGDWWYVVAQFEDRILPAFWLWDTTRPLVGGVWQLMFLIFGYHFLGWYIVLFITQALSAIVIWFLLWRYFQVPWTLAVLVAAFVLVYPSDTARVYIVALTNRHATLCCLLATWSWFKASQSGSIRAEIIWSSVCIGLLTIGLLLYEGPLGLVLILPVMVQVIQTRSLSIWKGSLRRWRALVLWYIGPLLFVGYRLIIEPAIPEIIHPQLIHLDFSPTRVMEELRYWPATTLWNGWLYTPVAVSRVESKALIGLLGIIFALICFFLFRQIPTLSKRFYLTMLMFGIVLLFVSAFPVVISSLDVSTMVGTLFGRTLSSAAFGHGVILVGLIGLLASFSRAAIAAALTTILLTLAVTASIGQQVIYANVWLSQLQLVASLEKYTPQLSEGSTIVLLDVPSGPYELRYAYPFTRLVRVLFGKDNLQVAPWLANFPAEHQLLLFGENSILVVETLDRMETAERAYQSAIAFRYTSSGEIMLVRTITSNYLLPPESKWFVNPSLRGRTQPVDLADPAEINTMPPQSSRGRPVLIGYCRRLLGECQNTQP